MKQSTSDHRAQCLQYNREQRNAFPGNAPSNAPTAAPTANDAVDAMADPSVAAADDDLTLLLLDFSSHYCNCRHHQHAQRREQVR